MKCETCKYRKTYTTGFDEYPAFTTQEYCSKDHWFGGCPGEFMDTEQDVWQDCKDYEFLNEKIL